MNKTIKYILALAVMSISFAACSQVDLVDDPESETSGSFSASVPLSDGYILIAHRVVGHYHKTLLNESSDSTLAGAYKFYAISYNDTLKKSFDYSAILDADSATFMSDCTIAYTGASAVQNVPDSMKTVLTGDFYNCKDSLFEDSTMVVDIKAHQGAATAVSFPTSAFLLNPVYTVKASYSTKWPVVYAVFSNVPTKVYLSGEAAPGSSTCNSVAILKNAGDADNANLFTGTFSCVKLPTTGEVTLYFSKDNKATASYKIKNNVITIGSIIK